MRAAQHSRSMWIIALQPGKYISNGIDPCRQARFLYPPDQEHYGFLIRGFPSKTTDSASGITSNMPYLVQSRPQPIRIDADIVFHVATSFLF